MIVANHLKIVCAMLMMMNSKLSEGDVCLKHYGLFKNLNLNQLVEM